MKNVPTHDAEQDRDERPDQVAARADPEHTDGEGRDLGVAHEPQRAEVPDLAVPLAERDVVDRADLDRAAAGFSGSRHRVLLGLPARGRAMSEMSS